MNDRDDRLWDAALQEVHGTRPPDLSARVLAALHEGPRGPLPQVRSEATEGLVAAGLGVRWWTLAALLLVTIGLGVGVAWFANEPPPAGGPQGAGGFRVDVEVLAGSVECIVDGVSMGCAERERPLPLPLAAGNRLRSVRASSFTLAPFGTLITDKNTELEVRSMEFTSKQGLVAASSLTLAVVAGVVTWQVMANSGSASAGESLRLEAQSHEVASLRAEVANLKQRLAAAETEKEAIVAAASVQRDPVTPAAPVEKPPVDAVPPVTAPASSVTFTDAKFDEALAKIDWTKIGATTAEMGPLLAQLAEAMAKEGAEMPIDLAVKVTKLNMDLVEQVPAMMETGLPGYGPNGSYTHPLVAANSLASTLAAAGQALSPAQQQTLAGLVRSFGAESQAIADATREFDLEQLGAELEMKERFFKEVGGVLRPEQGNVAFPPGSGTHDGAGLFSSGVLAHPYAQPVPAKDAADFARVASGKLSEQLGLDEAATAKVREVLARGAADPNLWSTRGDAAETSQLKMLRSGRTQAALRAQIQWMKDLQRQVPLTPEQRQLLAKMKNVLVPVPR
jgi:hypothetical protein